MIIDIAEKSGFADYFIIATGNTDRQVNSLADDVEDALAEKDLQVKSVEGKNVSGWILLDFGDVIIHLFDAQNRLFYDLERIWKDGTQIDPDAL